MPLTTTETLVGQHQSLDDQLYKINMHETPFLSRHGKPKRSKAVLEEWVTENIGAGSTNNTALEGADAPDTTGTEDVQVSNVHQINVKDVRTSGTAQAIKKVGPKAFRHQQYKRGVEMKKDINAHLLAAQARRLQGGGNTRLTATYQAWVTNGSVGDTGAMPTGDGTDVHTAGTARALTLTLIGDAMTAAFEAGGKPDTIVCSPTKKAKIKELVSSAIAANQVQVGRKKKAAIIDTVDIVATDFGELDIMVDRQMPNDRLYLPQWNTLGIAALPKRSYAYFPLGKSGDSFKGQMLHEWVYKPTTPTANAAIFDLT